MTKKSEIKKKYVKHKYNAEDTWSIYQAQSEAAAPAEAWSEEEKATAVILSVKGKAIKVLLSLPGTEVSRTPRNMI